MLDQPWTKCCGDDGCVFGFIGQTEGFLRLEVGLYVLEEGDVEGVALVEVRDVAVEACFGVFVG